MNTEKDKLAVRATAECTHRHGSKFVKYSITGQQEVVGWMRGVLDCVCGPGGDIVFCICPQVKVAVCQLFVVPF